MHRDDGRHLTAQDEDGAGTVLVWTLTGLVGGVLWVGVTALGIWAYRHPGEAVALVLLLLGSGLIFGALARMEEQ